MGFLEDVGARDHKYPMDVRSADWILRRIGHALGAGTAFLDTLTPFERRDLFESYCMQLPKKHPERVGFERTEREKLNEKCRKHLEEHGFKRLT